ncbi:DNA-binding protein [archaeon]|nr:MAG: DNA-binding protein [archaeon]
MCLDDLLWYAKKQQTHEAGSYPAGILHVLRLAPGEDLQQSIYKFARVKNIMAATIVSCVGSLTTTNIRYADDSEGTSVTGHFEIVSLVGNVDLQPVSSAKGAGHIHIAIADEQGRGLGGHLLVGNIVYTTAEITLLEVQGALFYRVPDIGPGGSGYSELKVYNLEENK